MWTFAIGYATGMLTTLAVVMLCVGIQRVNEGRR
jgi:hypothetical protein